MRQRFLLFTAAAAIGLLGSCDKPQPAIRDSDVAISPAEPDTGPVLDRPDWAAFEARLSKDPAIAASDLERYRRAHGLPFEFFLSRGAPEVLKRALERSANDGAPCGSGLVAFVRRFPATSRDYLTSPVYEVDSAGAILREWPLPNDVDYHEIVEGVERDELVASYLLRPGVHMRVKPNGEYRISSEAPTPLPRERWLALADSTWVRVVPRDEITFSMHSGFTRGVEPGRWVLHGDSGWYERVDSGPERGALARAIELSKDPDPRMLACPASSKFEGMVCRGFPDAGRERRIAYPSVCS
jgi:hypothetical protein